MSKILLYSYLLQPFTNQGGLNVEKYFNQQFLGKCTRGNFFPSTFREFYYHYMYIILLTQLEKNYKGFDFSHFWGGETTSFNSHFFSYFRDMWHHQPIRHIWANFRKWKLAGGCQKMATRETKLVITLAVRKLLKIVFFQHTRLNFFLKKPEQLFIRRVMLYNVTFSSSKRENKR